MGAKSRNKARLRRHRRVRKKIAGTPQKPRLNVYRSLSEIYAQLIDDEAGHTLVSASSIETDLQNDLDGLTKQEQAKKVGETLAKRAVDNGVEQVIFDRGGFKYSGRVKALADGAREGGLKF